LQIYQHEYDSLFEEHPQVSHLRHQTKNESESEALDTLRAARNKVFGTIGIGLRNHVRQKHNGLGCV
jgi:hypothetical protein